MQTSEAIHELATALAKAQAAMKPAAKDSINPHFKSRYADLASVWDAARAALTGNGLSVVQGASADGERVTVTTLLLHTSGQWIQDALTSSARDASAQSVGSAITYGRRYGLSAMVGIAPEDDDAEAATPRQPFRPASVEIQPAEKIAADVNSAVAAGFNGRVATARSFAQPVRAARNDDAPPLTDKDIPF